MRYSFLGLLALVGCVYTRTPVILANIPALGFTRCDFWGNPYILINESIVADSVLFQAVLIHENTHANRMIGRCKAFAKQYVDDLDFRLQEEARGFCASIEFYVKRGEDRNHLIVETVKILYMMYGLDKSPEEIFARIPCKGG